MRSSERNYVPPSRARTLTWQHWRVDHDCAVAILRKDDGVLLCHRHPERAWLPNVWDFPGGHVEALETHQQALARELYEELGVRIDAPAGPADAVLEYEAASIRLAVWSSSTTDRSRTALPKSTTTCAG